MGLLKEERIKMGRKENEISKNDKEMAKRGMGIGIPKML